MRSEWYNRLCVNVFIFTECMTRTLNICRYASSINRYKKQILFSFGLTCHNTLKYLGKLTIFVNYHKNLMNQKNNYEFANDSNQRMKFQSAICFACHTLCSFATNEPRLNLCYTQSLPVSRLIFTFLCISVDWMSTTLSRRGICVAGRLQDVIVWYDSICVLYGYVYVYECIVINNFAIFKDKLNGDTVFGWVSCQMMDNKKKHWTLNEEKHPTNTEWIKKVRNVTRSINSIRHFHSPKAAKKCEYWFILTNVITYSKNQFFWLVTLLSLFMMEYIY